MLTENPSANIAANKGDPNKTTVCSVLPPVAFPHLTAAT
ncbi:hypothetical protein EDC40_10729 [Aminobacter aminovorans]|uniref:Uncharacterized protein n=1 Tax=Aminobacter aminovorans TaxID=83263 RepID=A0A381IJU0_AMIAI|nr:hypothetical protein EDC40_10729 [Aminobacter aminovorans]SUY28165.1 Uncharacterised protein [Aminobacter aminovorans]